MKKQKKPLKSKPAAKKKAAVAPHPDRRLIDAIAARVSQLEAELKATNQKLEFLADQTLGRRKQEPQAIVAEVIESVDL